MSGVLDRLGVRYRDGMLIFSRATSNTEGSGNPPSYTVDIREVIALSGVFIISAICTLKNEFNYAVLLASNALSYAFGRVTTAQKKKATE